MSDETFTIHDYPWPWRLLVRAFAFLCGARRAATAREAELMRTNRNLADELAAVKRDRATLESEVTLLRQQLAFQADVNELNRRMIHRYTAEAALHTAYATVQTPATALRR